MCASGRRPRRRRSRAVQPEVELAPHGRDKGRATRAVSPPPGVDSSHIRPPCAWMSVRASDSPSPAPPVSRAREGSARKNRSNACSAASAGRPGPWSTTETTAGPAAAAQRAGRAAACSCVLEHRVQCSLGPTPSPIAVKGVGGIASRSACATSLRRPPNGRSRRRRSAPARATSCRVRHAPS